MAVEQSLIEKAALQLRTAAETGIPCAPVRDVLGTETDIDAAYAVQQLNTEHAIAAGREISGRKIGLTAEVVQQQLGVSEPDFGPLFADMCFADGVDIPAGRMLQPRAEAEIAVVLEDDLDKGEHCVVDIINATAYVLPSLELVDSRIADWNIRIVDTVADFASSGLYVVGSRPVALADLDLRTVTMSMSQNGTEVATGTGVACLGNPLHAATWLANVMVARGTPLRAGECIMTGSLGAMVPIAEGDMIAADFGELGTVTTTLRKGDA